jgi:hypothetical protein
MPEKEDLGKIRSVTKITVWEGKIPMGGTLALHEEVLFCSREGQMVQSFGQVPPMGILPSQTALLFHLIGEGRKGMAL